MRPLFDPSEAPRFTPAGRQALLEAVTAAPAATEAPRRSRRRLRAALVAAAAVCLLTMTAAAVLLSLPVLRAHFGGAGYDQSSMLVGKSVTSEGWTMTLTDCVGDDRYLVLGFELEAPQGTVLDPEVWRDSYPAQTYSFPSLDGAQASHWYAVEDNDPTDNRRQYAFWIEHMTGEPGGESINGAEMELKLEGVGHTTLTPEKHLQFVPLCDETWDFGTFTLTYPDQALRLEPNVPVTVLDVPAAVTHLTVSPIGVDVWLEGEALRGHNQRYPWGQCISLPEVTLYDKQGKALEPDRYTPFGIRGGSGCNGGEAPGLPCIHINQSYGYLLDMDSLDHITVCGVSIPLSPAASEP